MGSCCTNQRMKSKEMPLLTPNQTPPRMEEDEKVVEKWRSLNKQFDIQASGKQRSSIGSSNSNKTNDNLVILIPQTSQDSDTTNSNTNTIETINELKPKEKPKPTGEMIEIKIKSMKSQYPEIKITINNLSKVIDLKQQIEKETPDNIPFDRQRLIHKGRLLKDLRTLKHFRVENNQTIMLVRSRKSTTVTTLSVANNSGAYGRSRSYTSPNPQFSPNNSRSPSPQGRIPMLSTTGLPNFNTSTSGHLTPEPQSTKASLNTNTNTNTNIDVNKTSNHHKKSRSLSPSPNKYK